MTQLEQLELILRRMADRRKRNHENGKSVLNVDVQDFIEELAAEIARVATPPQEQR